MPQDARTTQGAPTTADAATNAPQGNVGGSTVCRKLDTELTHRRVCLKCGCSIALRGPTAKYCRPCAALAKKEADQCWDRHYRSGRPAKARADYAPAEPGDIPPAEIERRYTAALQAIRARRRQETAA